MNNKYLFAGIGAIFCILFLILIYLFQTTVNLQKDVAKLNITASFLEEKNLKGDEMSIEIMGDINILKETILSGESSFLRAVDKTQILPKFSLSLDESDYNVTCDDCDDQTDLIQAIAWVVEDERGVILLSRNAKGVNSLGRKSIRYYAHKEGESYAIYLKAWNGGKYSPISNIIKYTVKSN